MTFSSVLHHFQSVYDISFAQITYRRYTLYFYDYFYPKFSRLHFQCVRKTT